MILKIETFYKDVSRHPENGDEYIQLVCENENQAFELRVFKGVLGGEVAITSYICDTYGNLETAWLKQKNDAGRKGFKSALGYPVFGNVEKPRTH